MLFHAWNLKSRQAMSLAPFQKISGKVGSVIAKVPAASFAKFIGVGGTTDLYAFSLALSYQTLSYTCRS
jgi:hypothetical protein